METKAIIQNYLNAISERDFSLARGFLADDYQFIGPTFSTETAEAFLEQLSQMPMEVTVKIESMVSDQTSVAVVASLEIKPPTQSSLPTCEVFDLEAGKITRSRFFFDTAKFNM